MTATTHERHRTRFIVTATAVLTLAISTWVTPAHASTADDEPAAGGYELSQEQLLDLEALTAATSTDEQVFDSETARGLGATETSIVDYALALEASGWTVIGAVDSSAATDEGTAARACAGASQYNGYFFPIGYQFALNSCQTAQLIAGIGIIVAGGSVATAAAALTGAGVPVAAVIGIITAIVGLGVAFLIWCQATSSYSAIYVNSGSPGLVPPSCWAQ